MVPAVSQRWSKESGQHPQKIADTARKRQGGRYKVTVVTTGTKAQRQGGYRQSQTSRRRNSGDHGRQGDRRSGMAVTTGAM